MNKILLTLYTLSSCLTVFGQTDSIAYGNNSFVIALSTGGTFPIGKFAKFEIDSSKYTENIAGAATAGYNLRLNADYFFNQNFGIAFCLQRAKTRSKEPLQGEIYYDPAPWSHGMGGGNQLYSYSYNTGDWKISEVTSGIIAKVSSETSDRIDFYFRLMGGLIIVESPKAELIEKRYVWQMNDTNEYYYSRTIVQPASQSYSLCGSIEADVRYSLNARRNLLVLISIEYLTSHCVFHAEKNYLYENGNETATQFSFPKNVNTIGVNLGIAWVFRK